MAIVDKNLSLLQCPQCTSKLTINPNDISCDKCSKKYPRTNNFVDFIKNQELDLLSKEALKVWGMDLHKDNQMLASHLYSMKRRLKNSFKNFKGSVLEIGCGAGNDLKLLNKDENIKLLIGLDIGENTANLANETKMEEKILILRGNAESIPIVNRQMDVIYTYGVIHHTKRPEQALKECKRLLKKNGVAFMYLYSSHTNNILKRIGIIIETLIMTMMVNKPRKFKLFLCYAITPIAWLGFTLPAIILRHFGFKKIARKMPLNWGTTPLSIFADIKDRLLAPVNHRYSERSINYLLEKVGLKSIEIVEDSTGVYIAAIPT